MLIGGKKQIEFKLLNMYWLLGKKSKLSLRNKILLYKVIIRPIWAYACQLWACAANSNIQYNKHRKYNIIGTEDGDSPE